LTGVSYRSVIIGLLLIPLNAMWLALAEEIWYSGEVTTLSIYANAVAMLCALVVANALAGRIRPQWALTPSELLVIYIMLAIATSLEGHDMIPVLMPTLSHLHYHHMVEGRYAEILRFVPEWLLVSDDAALEGAYLGQESIYRARNLVPWLGPLAWWFTFLLALCAVMWGLNLLFRKQWTEHEKLAYPIIQVPMMVVVEPRSLTGSRAFWIALAIAGGIDVINGLNALYPMMPKIPIVQVWNIQTLFTERPWTDMGLAWISFFPSVIGLSFFIPLDLAFSSWFFFIFWKMQRVLASHFGLLGMGGGFPYVQEQAVGGFYAIALIALWITRHQFRRMGKLLIGRGMEDATTWERKEAYLSVALIAGGGVFISLFCRSAGMSWPVIAAFFTLYFLMSIGMTRMRAELGAPSHDIYPMGAHRQLVDIVGAIRLKDHNRLDVIMFGFLSFFNRCMRTHPMPQGMEGFKIGQRMKMRNGPLMAAMWVAVVWGVLCGIGALLWSYNKYGITAQASPLPDVLSGEAWNNVEIWLTSPPKYRTGPALAIATGLLSALGLAALRLNLAWWPFHPVGYAIAASLTMERMWFCIFIAWLAKSLILKYGGVNAYRSAQSFFAGLLLGDFFVGSFWFTYGAIMETKVYHFWPY